MARIDKTVFISYRRVDRWQALAVFTDLTQHGYDVFIDYDGIASGDFERAIVDNIRARAHFVLLLTPSALTRCDDPKDWMRREIEVALEARRNIVPLLLDGFTFEAPLVVQRLQGSLGPLVRCNALRVPADSAYFDSAMGLLRGRYLAIAVDAVTTPASPHAQQVAHGQQEAASKAAAQIGQEGPQPKPRTRRATPSATPIQEQSAAAPPPAAVAKTNPSSREVLIFLAIGIAVLVWVAVSSDGKKEKADPVPSPALVASPAPSAAAPPMPASAAQATASSNADAWGIKVSKTKVDFGSIGLAADIEAQDAFVQVTNTSQRSLSITLKPMSVGPFSHQGCTNKRLIDALLPTQDCGFYIKYVPTKLGRDHGEMRFFVDGLPTDMVVAVDGNAVPEPVKTVLNGIDIQSAECRIESIGYRVDAIGTVRGEPGAWLNVSAGVKGEPSLECAGWKTRPQLKMFDFSGSLATCDRKSDAPAQVGWRYQVLAATPPSSLSLSLIRVVPGQSEARQMLAKTERKVACS